MSNSFYIIGRTGETALLVSEKKFNYTYNWDVLIKKNKKNLISTVFLSFYTW